MQAHNPTPLHLYYTPLYTFSMYLNQLIAGIRCHLQSVDLDTQKKLQQYCPNINNNNQTNINNKVKPKQKSSHSPFLSLVTTCSFSSYGAPSQRHSASFNIGWIYPSGYTCRSYGKTSFFFPELSSWFSLSLQSLGKFQLQFNKVGKWEKSCGLNTRTVFTFLLRT